ncbi:AI-2E family transporter [Candidatus Woesebacteria bacterium]|jgi:predicted PurR-regulated permease PerM|nr:AI-2E family transporter [Candidatus Woesebacteria bacterium]MBP9687034.1 AI-2E family transporter [Candidatus Woesebacteria bacterium]
MTPRKVEVSHRTIIFTTLFLIGLGFLFYIRDILVQLFVALLITIVLNPLITKLEKKRIPRPVSIVIVYLTGLSIFIFAVANMVPLLVVQTTNFAVALPRYLAELRIPNEIVDAMTKQLTSQLAGLPSQLLSISIEVFSNVLTIVAVLIFALYFLLARRDITHQLSNYLHEGQIKKIEAVLSALERQLGGWARGQMLLMIIVGLSNYVGFLILGVPYALSLSILAGILEAVPNLGPILAALPAAIVGFGVSPITGMATIALAFLVQQVEAYVFVPKVMQKQAGVNPIITLLSLIIGARVYGIVGAVLSVPVAITIRVLLETYYHYKFASEE